MLEELWARAYTATVKVLAHPNPAELDINEQSLGNHKLEDLVIEFSGLSIRLDAHRPTHYYRVVHNIGPEPKNGPMFPLFV
ncbi:hypothetical protein D3Y59_12825 [Hymenobacter oligotrophus]|uniref:Uncharacterized protein n=1 Tax=Hymenobacter oligotrophus TaxID=2319843 RepID=A0A3B7RAT4_9BACT|nr:hypothetical protein D3Y59_12825 [Hymenobacter oligotrophus]